jgi:hypothetical protein
MLTENKNQESSTGFTSLASSQDASTNVDGVQVMYISSSTGGGPRIGPDGQPMQVGTALYLRHRFAVSSAPFTRVQAEAASTAADSMLQLLTFSSIYSLNISWRDESFELDGKKYSLELLNDAYASDEESIRTGGTKSLNVKIKSE